MSVDLLNLKLRISHEQKFSTHQQLLKLKIKPSGCEFHMNESSTYHPTKSNCHLLFVEQITYCLLTKAIKVKKKTM